MISMRNLRRLAVVILFIIFTSLIWAEETAFKMEEFSVFDVEGQFQQMLMSANSSQKCTDEPDDSVTAYPAFTSQKPLYGSVLFFTETLFPRIEYVFALDESEGTGKGYDRLYFDGNHDFNLKNDPVVKKSDKTWKRPYADDEVALFESLTFTVNGESVTFVPGFEAMSPDYRRVNLIYPTARRGTIKIGSQEHEAVLAKMVLAGGYDQPYSFLLLDDKVTGLDLLGRFHNVDGQLYQCTASPAGDTITVKPYSGDFGTLAIADPQKKYKSAEISMGYLMAKDKFVDLGQCPKKDDVAQIPAGDYMPLRIAMQVDDIRLGFTADLSEESSFKPAYAIKIRKNEPFEYDLANRPEIRFDSPKTAERIIRGDELKVSAGMLDAKMNTLLAGMEDMSRPEGEPMDLPDGTTFQRYQSIDPMVRITNAAGEQVASGKMPFG